MGERIILSNDPIPIEIGIVKTIGTKKQGAMMDLNEDDFHAWNSDEDEDDERIS